MSMARGRVFQIPQYRLMVSDGGSNSKTTASRKKRPLLFDNEPKGSCRYGGSATNRSVRQAKEWTVAGHDARLDGF
jgi:hypothetical protein